MDFLYGWIKSIAIYMILISVVKNLLPKSQFEKYLRLFTGLLVIILVIEPFTQWMNLQDSMDDLFSLDAYKQEMNQLQADFSQLGDKYEERVLGSYERQVKEQIELLLKEEDQRVRKVEFFVCMEEGAEDYGQLTRIDIYLENESENGGVDGEEKNGGYMVEIETPRIESPFAEEYHQLEREKLVEKICAYYQLERDQVKIYG